jgi:hydroxymethylbilane synthase
MGADQLMVRGLVGDPDGKTILTAVETGKIADANSIGQKVAQSLLDQGAKQILDVVYGEH